MKLKLQNEKVIYLGKTNEEAAWGWIQFPAFFDTRDGNIGLYVHDDDDSWMSIDGETTGKWFVSEDKGASWRPASKDDKDKMGTVLPNGDVIRSLPNPPTSLKGVKESGWKFATQILPGEKMPSEIRPADDNTLPYPITVKKDIFEQEFKIYWLDSVPDKLIDKRFCFSRLKKGESKAEKYHVLPKWNYRTVISFPPHHATKTDLEEVMLAGIGLYACRRPIVAPDGSIYIADYKGNGANPFTGVYEGNCNSYILRSTDNGENWEIQGYIPYRPDTEKDKLAYLKSGFSEPDLAFMPDGSMLCILRTCDVFGGAPEWGPTYLTRSTDGGKTWSTPEYFKDRGALPKLLQLKNGVTLAVITRPGIFVYASNDCGKTWSQVVEVMTDKDRSGLANVPPEKPNFHQWAGSCCNCSIIALEDNKALLVYSDFYIPDENGVKRKGIKTVEIVVE
ncbi:MAG: exo-alpha-sialidase [Clostridia bacterium]|nr:exo-alpha-sialidase [Clostridia bacterium]